MAAQSISAFKVTRTGRASQIEAANPDILRSKGAAGSYRWVHIQGDLDFIATSLSPLKLDTLVLDGLLANETRPRCSDIAGGALLILRGVNLNEGAEPEDMISLRVWIADGLIVSCGIRQLRAVRDLIGAMELGCGPKSIGEFISLLAVRLADRAEPIIAQLNDAVDDVEEEISGADFSATRSELSSVRRASIIIRRYMYPQRDALRLVETAQFGWISALTRAQLREASDRFTRLCEDLDAIRDRSQMLQDQVRDAQAERMNQQMLVLTIVAAFFLPISFLTGLLGMNVGGVPLTESPFGFLAICGFILALLALEYLIFKKLKLI